MPTLICAGCGHANGLDARFCEECGRSLAPRCASCGAEVSPTAHLCSTVIEGGLVTRGEVFGRDQIEALRARMAELGARD